jgi:hypothetical protein
MSLQLAAKHLAAHGRGKDKMLVHMDKGEVDSLQKIAMANGGSLTINPQTGLPEAGFLSALLPMIAGAGLMMIPGMQAGAAGLIVGGLQTARTGSLSKGIMAGLGAYGGAGLAGSAGAAGAGATNAANASANTIPQYGPSFTDAQSFDPSVLNASPVSAPVNNLAQGAPSINPQYDLAANASPYPQYGDPNLQSAYTKGLPPVSPNAGIPQAGPSFTDGQSMGYPAGTQPPTIPKSFEGMNAADRASSIKSGASFENAGDFIANNKYTAAGALASVASGMKKDPVMTQPDKDMGQRYSYNPNTTDPIPAPDVPSYDEMLSGSGNYGRQQKYFTPSYTPISNTAAKELYNYADGGPVEQMSNNAAMGANTMYPMANTATSSFATPYQAPQSTNMLANMVAPSGGGAVNAMSGEPSMQGTRMAEGGEAESRPSYTYDPQAQKYTAGPSISEGAPNDNFLASVARSFGVRQEEQDPALKYAYNPQSRQYQQMASGGISDAGYNLGGYSDGGRLLRGPGDGVSDSIPAVIGKKQPARLADGEFVVPARIVSELGNGSTEAGARKLYAMMDRIQAARKKTVGKDKVAHNSRSSKYLPA